MSDVETKSIEIIGVSPEAPCGYRVRCWVARRAVRLLSVALALALTAIVVMGALLYLDHRDTRTAQEKAQIAAAMAFVDAANAHDVDRMVATLAPSGELVFVGPHGVVEGPFAREALKEVAPPTMPGFHLEVIGEPVVVRLHLVSMTLHMTRAGDDRTDVHLFQLVPVNDELKIFTVMIV